MYLSGTRSDLGLRLDETRPDHSPDEPWRVRAPTSAGNPASEGEAHPRGGSCHVRLGVATYLGKRPNKGDRVDLNALARDATRPLPDERLAY